MQTNSNRSLGWVFANSIGAANTYASIGFGLSNASGLAFDSFSLAYTGREWRGYSNTTPVLSFQYKIGGTFDNDSTNSLSGNTAWTDFSSLNFVLPVTNNNAQVNGLNAPNFTAVSNTVSGLSWGTDQVLWVRWRQQNLSGTDAQLALDDIVFNALSTPITGGAFWAADSGGGGSGTWTSAGTTWATNAGGAGAGQTQTASLPLIFTDAAGTVTVSGGVIVSNGLTFKTTGYDLQSSTITLAGATTANNAITTDSNVTTTISSELAGTTGMTKSGSGTLILTGANTFSGSATITAGTLQIAADSALGNTASDLLNNGTLRTTANVSLNAGRDITGSGTFDITDGTTLTINGNINNTATTLANTGTFSAQGSTRSLGSITLNAAGTMNAVGAINATALTAPGVSNGTATINPDIVFTSGDKLLNVAAGGTVDLNGALSNGGTNGRIIKTGAGTLILNANSMGGLRVGSNAVTSVDGGTVVLKNGTIGTQPQGIQLNYGTVSAASNLVFTNGITIGGQTNGAAILTGGNMEFQGQSTLFRDVLVTGPITLKISNSTTFSGGFAVATGGAAGAGLVIGGNGEVFISGNSTALLNEITLNDSVKLTLASSIGGGLNVGANNVLGGNGTVLGSLSFAAGAKFVFDLTQPLIVNGPAVTFDDFGIEDLIGLDNTVANGTYTIIDGLATINTNNLSNFGAANAYDLGGGKSAYFTVGSLEVNVVPEPSTYALLSLSALGLAGHVIRRRHK